MGKRFLLTLIVAVGLFISACEVQTGPATPTPGLPIDKPEPPFTPTIGPSTISGDFVLTNTSAPGMEVGIETMAIVLEYRSSTAGQWKKVETDCAFDPPAPLVLKKELVVQYECSYKKPLPPNAEVHTTAEVRIYGSEEVFKLEVNSP
jgi:hypothetical protein